MNAISIRGARTHNLKNIDIDLPRDKLVVITGLSGSGKSSLAFDTLFAEGQRRYIESLSAYARQFLSVMEKPDLDHIEGLSPAIAIEQKSSSHNPRSTVGTITEIHDYLRLLYARTGIPRCPHHQIDLELRTISQMVDQILALADSSRWLMLAPVVRGRKGEHSKLIEDLQRSGYLRLRIDGKLREIDDLPTLAPRRKHDIDVVVDRFHIHPDMRLRLSESLETTTQLSDGLVQLVPMEDPEQEGLLFSTHFSCPHCGYSLAALEPRLFSFNNPAGACPDCEGLGVRHYFSVERVVAHPQLSIGDGAITGWDRRNRYSYQILESVAQHYGFDIKKPFAQLAELDQNHILHGSGNEKIHFQTATEYHKRGYKRAFEGILPNLERRYRDTESTNVREELAQYMSYRSCDGCQGQRLNEAARNTFIKEHNIAALSQSSIADTLAFFDGLNLAGKRGEIARQIIREINNRLRFLVNVGLNYLSLDRSAHSLSGGEAQRIRLASQIGAGLVGVMYVLDEPSIGLHQRDNNRLIKTLLRLRDLGNTVIVVEHDEEAIWHADHVIDMGPGAGIHGGEVVVAGSPECVAHNKQSLTGRYLSGQLAIPIPKKRRQATQWLTIHNARGNNLQALSVPLPLGIMTCVTGVSGSGKSTLINDTLYPWLSRALYNSSHKIAEVDDISGIEPLDKVVDIDQSPIGRTPRSNPATYTGLFTPIRELFAATAEARSRGYLPGRFSFNVKGGRCEACQGGGLIKVEMHFLPNIYVSCDVCKGKRYQRETLDICYKGRNIQQVLGMSVEEACDFFSAIPVLKRKLSILMQVGLSYIQLGQNAATLSGGEAQRIKLARELSRVDTGKTIYILDEPTTGLHFHDIAKLLEVLQELCQHGNSIVIIEHNLDVIKTADWIIDLGPEGGAGGGQLVATGTPETISKCSQSHTGRYLKRLLQQQQKRAS